MALSSFFLLCCDSECGQPSLCLTFCYSSLSFLVFRGNKVWYPFFLNSQSYHWPSVFLKSPDSAGQWPFTNTHAPQDFGIWRQAAVSGHLIRSKCMHMIFGYSVEFRDVYKSSVDTDCVIYTQSTALKANFLKIQATCNDLRNLKIYV